jgi:predicted lipid-binding transport protein (Tim44 family)
MKNNRSKLASAFGIVLAMGLLAAEPADARRGGSFGSRGMRTYQAPPPTRTAPQQTAPVQRSMTQAPAPGQQPGARPATAGAAGAAQPQRRGGFLGGLGGGILGGLLVGGLIGAMMGNGFGAGMGGMMTILLQLAIVGLAVFLLMKLFRRRQQQQQPAMAGQAGQAGWAGGASRFEAPATPRESFQQPYVPTGGAAAAGFGADIQVAPSDRDAFERLLTEIQDAFGREDYAALRERTTPEIMSYLAEELSQNATNGRRNEVSGTRLLEADVSESWSEEERDYATAALRYESVDVTRDRQTGAVVEGDPSRPTETTELWTFVRSGGGPWKLSAIQDA